MLTFAKWPVFVPMLAVALLSGAGCVQVGTVAGAIDGEDVPPFTSAAFGRAKTEQADGVVTFSSVTAMALPSDSCANAAQHRQFELDRITGTLIDLGALESQALFINNTIPVGAWFARVDTRARVEGGEADPLFEGQTEFSEQQGAANLNITLCRQARAAATVPADVTLDDGADCYIPQAAFVIALAHTEDGDVRVFADTPFALAREDGSAAGDITFDIEFTACSDMNTAEQVILGLTDD